MNKKFIKTNEPATKEFLLKKGFVLINEVGGIATFINDTSKKVVFDNMKVVYSNKLCV